MQEDVSDMRADRLSRRSVLLGAAAAGVTANLGFAQAVMADMSPLSALVDDVSAVRLRDTVLSLSSFPTRWTNGPGFAAIENWMVAAFSEAAAGTVTRQPYLMPSNKTRHNIVVGNPMDPRGVIVVGAHLDSISETPEVLAPGANDNATGIAALLEAHRILSPLTLGKELVFIAFSGEEQDLLGSAACAQIAARDGWPIELMINLDMLGYRPTNPAAPLIIEFDQGNALPGNDAAAATYGAMSARLAAEHTSLNTTHTDIWDSDYMPFEAMGFPCIGFYDGGCRKPAVSQRRRCRRCRVV